MKEYDVKITETLEKTVTVEAKSRADAEEQVRTAYYNSEYILDSENFTGVEFGTTEEREIQQEQAETMTVLLVKPYMYPQQVQIGCDLEDLQKAVGGDIEAVYPFNEPVALVMHDEGKIMGKDLNRALRDGDGEIYDIIAGDFLVVGLGEEDTMKKNSVPLSPGKACTSLRVVSGRLLNRSSSTFSLIFSLRWQREKRLDMNAGQRNTTVKKLPGQSAS